MYDVLLFISVKVQNQVRQSLDLNQCCIRHEHRCDYSWPHRYYADDVPSSLLESFLIRHGQNVRWSMNCTKRTLTLIFLVKRKIASQRETFDSRYYAT